MQPNGHFSPHGQAENVINPNFKQPTYPIHSLHFLCCIGWCIVCRLHSLWYSRQGGCYRSRSNPRWNLIKCGHSSRMKNSADLRIPVSFHSEKSIQFSFDAPFLWIIVEPIVVTIRMMIFLIRFIFYSKIEIKTLSWLLRVQIRSLSDKVFSSSIDRTKGRACTLLWL